MDPGHWTLLQPIGLVYVCVNAYQTISSGNPDYWFLDWKCWRTPVIIIAIQVTFSLLFVGIARTLNSLKNSDDKQKK